VKMFTALGRAVMFQRDGQKTPNTARMVKCEAREGLGSDAGEGGGRQNPAVHCPEHGALLVQEPTMGPGKGCCFPEGDSFGMWENNTGRGENK